MSPSRIPATSALQVAVLIVGAAGGSLVAGVMPGSAYVVAAVLLALSGTLALASIRRFTQRDGAASSAGHQAADR